MEFNRLLQVRRSVRKYQEKAVPTSLISELISESTAAPSARNDQPWKFIIVNDQDVMQEISDEAKRSMLARIASDPNDYAKRYEKMLSDPEFDIFYNAPSLVYVVGDRDLKNVVIDCSIVATYFMLAAASRGLGTCWVNFATVIDSEAMLERIGVPNNCRIVAPIAVGYPAVVPKMPARREPEILRIIEEGAIQ